MLRIYHTAVDGANVISRGGLWNAQDVADVDGTDGGENTRTLYLAPAQTAITDAVAESTAGTIENIHLDDPIFDSKAYSIVVCGSEKMLIVGGWQTRDVTVQRGYDNTTAAAHDAATAVINCYTYNGITIGRTGDDASWLTFAPGASGGSFATSLSPAAMDYDGSYTFRRKITVAASTDRQRNQAALPTLVFTAIEAL